MSVQSTTALLAFYHVTKIEDWMYTNMMNYYQEKTEKRKGKNCYIEWKSSSKTLDTPLIIQRFQVEQLVTGESATNIVNKHCEEIKIARNMTQGIKE
ncbi:40406_t:CDS:2, partial [Gigaspora margarita]